jgi:predicted enzyme related to lactoylglutathione lyase
MATATNVQRQFAWYELMTPDPKAGQAFYTKLFGWGLQDFEAAKEPYVMWTRNDEPFGGVMRLPDEAKQMGAPPHWLPYVGVTKTDTTVDEATKLGARVFVPPTDIPGGGRFAVLGDPQGAVFGVVSSSQPKPEPPESETPQIGQVSWHELATTDQDAAFTFYNTLFGWAKSEAMDMGPDGKYQMFNRGPRMIGGMMNKPKEMAEAPPFWAIYFRVPDIDAAADRIKAAGGRILNGPMEVPGGDRILNAMDPQGASFSLHAKKTA